MPTPRSDLPPAGAPARAVLFTLIVSPLAAMLASGLLPAETARRMLSERGPIEQLSPLLWMLLGVFSLGLFGLRTLTAWAAAWIAFAAAAREAGWHKAFTEKSVLKLSMYLSDEDPLASRAIAGAIVALIAAALVWIAQRLFHRARCHPAGPKPAWLKITIMVIVTLLVSKVFDRSIAMTEDALHTELPMRVKLLIWSVEETLEMLLPLATAAGMLCFATGGSGCVDQTLTNDPTRQNA